MPPSRDRLRTHALAAQALGNVFVELGLSASLFDGATWHPIHIPVVFQHSEIVADVVIFERVHGVESRRGAYNARSIRSVRRGGGALLAEHAGFHDLFVPIGSWGMLVTGPFALERPTSAALHARWRWLTGRSARASDPEFARYLATALATTTFEGTQINVFRRWLECFAALLYGQRPVEAVAAQARALRQALRDVRYVERMWTAARNLIDEGVWRSWQGRGLDLEQMGLRRLPQRAVVGLLPGRTRDMDPIDDLVRRDAFQRACVAMVRARTGALCGPIGDHGVVFLVDESGAGARAIARLESLGRRAATLAHDLGLRLYVGVGAAQEPFVLPTRYQSALSAAERALSQGLPVVVADTRTEHAPGRLLDELRHDLAQAVGESPTVLAPRFERYLESVRVHCGYRVEATRVHLEVGLHQVLRGLSAAGALDDRSAVDLTSALERASRDAFTVGDLSTAYRKAVSDIELALGRPREARQDHGLRRAIAFMREHMGERLSLAKVSNVAGFAPSYFSKLFLRTEGMTFRESMQRLRVERAKQMLASTTLSAERVGQLCGFPTRQCFHAIFRRLAGVTPHQHRQRAPA